MNRILLIQQHQGREDFYGAVFPIGLCYIATPLSAMGKEVRIFDMNTRENPYEELNDELKSFQPELVGYSLRNIDTQNLRDIFYYFKTCQPTLQAVKKVVPKATIVIGGAGFSMFPQKVMERVPEADFGVLLEGEDTLPDLIQNIDTPEKVKGIYYRSDGRVKFTGDRVLPDLSQVPIPRRDYVDVKSYVDGSEYAIGILSKRGCPLRCAYCNYPFLNGEKIRRTDAEKVVDEIEYLINSFGVRSFMFVDGVFNAPKKHAMDICQEIINRGLDVKWKAWCDIKHFQEDFLELAHKAGCRAFAFSPDAATDEALEAMKKGIKAKDIDRVFRLVRKYKDITSGFGFFAMTPNQSFVGVMRTIYMYMKFNVLLYPHGGAHIARIRIEPKTHILEVAKAEGLMDDNTELLPYDEADLKNMFYRGPISLWAADQMIKATLVLMERLLIPVARTTKRLLRGPAMPVAAE